MADGDGNGAAGDAERARTGSLTPGNRSGTKSVERASLRGVAPSSATPPRTRLMPRGARPRNLRSFTVDVEWSR